MIPNNLGTADGCTHLLRRSLVEAWNTVSSIQKEFTAYANMSQAMLAYSNRKIIALEEEKADLQNQIRQMRRELAVHENYIVMPDCTPSSDNTAMMQHRVNVQKRSKNQTIRMHQNL